jgi:hypothetical protein
LEVTNVVHQINYFKTKISSILKRHCCNTNGSCVILVQKYCSKSQTFQFKQTLLRSSPTCRPCPHLIFMIQLFVTLCKYLSEYLSPLERKTPLNSSPNNLLNGGPLPSKHYTNQNNHAFCRPWPYIPNFLLRKKTSISSKLFVIRPNQYQ